MARLFAPASKLEEGIFRLWKELRPDDAFAMGLEECAGRFFVPTPGNVRRAVATIDRLKASTRDPAARKFLAAMRTRLTLPEPAALPEGILESLFMYMVKEGVRDDHIRSLLIEGRKALEAGHRTVRAARWPAGMRALVLNACHGLGEVLDTVEKEAREPATLEALAALRTAVARYEKVFALEGFRPDGTFEEIFEAFRRHGADLGRARTYAKALRDLWDYSETPAQVEAAGLRMMRRELPRFQAIVRSFAEELDSEPTGEAVDEALKKTRGLAKDAILPFLNGLREVAIRVARKHLIDINPKYTTLVVETPSYLANMTPSGAAFSLDTLTDHPREIFLATTDERSNPRPTAAELLNLLVHEEYGHCVHGSNAAHRYRADPGILDILNGPAVCTSEGLAFQIELDFVPILQGIAARRLRGPEEDAFVEFLRGYGGVERMSREYEFNTMLWRIVRFLRVVGDARINSGKQGLVDFVEWAHERTGLRKATVYYQVFPAHQVLGPGYASTYAIIGARVGAIQKEALRRGKRLRDYNGYAASIGWPARSVFEAKLEAWAKAK